MSGLFGTESRATSSFILQTISGTTLAAAGGAVVSNNFSVDELRRLFIRINSYTNPAETIPLRVSIFSASSSASTLQIPNVAAEMFLPPTGALPASRFADFLFLNSDIVWNSQTTPHSTPETNLYNNANITPTDANGNIVTINNCMIRSTQVAGRLVGKFRVLIQNWSDTTAFTYGSIIIAAVK